MRLRRVPGVSGLPLELPQRAEADGLDVLGGQQRAGLGGDGAGVVVDADLRGVEVVGAQLRTIQNRVEDEFGDARRELGQPPAQQLRRRILPAEEKVVRVDDRAFIGRRSGTGMTNSPVRYLPVSEAGLAITSSGVPSATMRPPCTPAPGPTSTT